MVPNVFAGGEGEVVPGALAEEVEEHASRGNGQRANPMYLDTSLNPWGFSSPALLEVG